MTRIGEPQRMRRIVLPLLLLLGDAITVFAGFSAAYALRYASPIGHLGIPVPDATFAAYLPLLLLGTVFLLAAYTQLDLYTERLLLRRLQSLNLILKGTVLWLAAYLGLSLVLKFEPAISRWFVVLAAFCVLALMYVWRTLAYAWLTRPALVGRLRQRAAVLGWNDDTAALIHDLRQMPAHPFAFVGYIRVEGDPETTERQLGSIDSLPEVLAAHKIDVLIASRTDLPREQLRMVVETCEATYVEWKVVPSSFQILISGLRLQTVGRVPILGVEDLAINRLFNRIAKRATDVAGAVVGLVLSAPLIALLALLIKRESPNGPLLFRQERVGARHRPFTLLKLRSMTPDAAGQDHLHGSTLAGDPRLLKIGAWMRRWNLDELPQFWNVLKGDMSLVGPRPERTHHVNRLSGIVPHYLPRHLVRPGMTGWAQVNGLRGDSSIARRIQHDIYYIENWSPWLDLQIILLTFVRWKNPAT
ncbi:MAG TPA: exopolysaccharide biosynthesis polyprenyl glycosylphosphotransferase [Opitutaceae bacterium]|nr:exopolysaccharide biosynthesis polyprenyl glycosylphosphotransferase [Opitutaceae bacterium]